MKLRASKKHGWEELSIEDEAVARSKAHEEYCDVNNRVLSSDNHVIAWLAMKCDSLQSDLDLKESERGGR